MIVVDSSAIIAILFDEAEASGCMTALQKEGARLISAVNYVEAGTVMAGRIRSGNRREAIADLDAFLTDFRIDIAPVDDRLARAAMKARIDYGRGFGTRGGLNFGDCFVYALAKQHSAPLLYVGNDFDLTDIRLALSSTKPQK
ncbi:type II toxin-antitoxin system VapC family toxin [Verrucomicrobium sp. 3C]|uniref:type II toxin-antitoxin system VapC family toxin n=1 Tax=Verrucomicrobium sp. 3C TaxID=1134055 RepID=UPI000362998B|nr:type II toxin-antitoxin system VapC family toxin [Verrucomicrobium sp. 3C]